jgi:hypothetical protein
MVKTIMPFVLINIFQIVSPVANNTSPMRAHIVIGLPPLFALLLLFVQRSRGEDQ